LSLIAERMLKISQHLAKLLARVPRLFCFLDSTPDQKRPKAYDSPLQNGAKQRQQQQQQQQQQLLLLLSFYG